LTSFYKIYHGNLAFSAIEESELPKVIDNCYFPFLSLIEKTKVPLALELSGYTLEKIQKYRPHWITRFKSLLNQGLVELIGSGYMQIIGPLVPYEVNVQNQKIGLKTYHNILGIYPKLAYVNEQVFSNSLVDIYHEVGYQGIIMEWNNAFSKHKEWCKNFSFTPVMVRGLKHKLPLLWTDSIIFQKFQRLIHNEAISEDYLAQINAYIQQGYKALPIYSSDIEIFNYRPGRFETEAIIEHDEWQVITETVRKLNSITSFSLPSEVIENYLQKEINLTLATNCSPVIVKKQQKYSLSRWAACGRGATHINHLCYNYFLTLGESAELTEWKKLLQYWGSDYRTHITPKKWRQALDFLTLFTPKAEIIKPQNETTNSFSVKQEKHQLIIQKGELRFTFLTLKGLCLESVHINGNPLSIGTVRHGDLDFIHHGADYYTGTTVIDSAEHGRITDLCRVNDYSLLETDNKIILSAVIPLKRLGQIEKSWCIDLEKHQLTFNAKIILKNSIRGSIRTGAVTLTGKSKNKSFWYECKNGGEFYERYVIDNKTIINHAQTQSLLQSSQSGIGATNGVIAFGVDKKRFLTVKIDQTYSYPFVMLQNSIDNNQFLTRLFFSMQELDDTLKDTDNNQFRLKYSINLLQ